MSYLRMHLAIKTIPSLLYKGRTEKKEPAEVHVVN
jgi:hypothetical protein